MKIQNIGFCLAAALMLLVGCASPSSTRLTRVIRDEVGQSRHDIPDYRCTIGAHRGASVEHLENTLAALKAAQNNPKYAFVEFDIQYTADERIVLFHDIRMTRVFGNVRSVGKSTYEELLKAADGDIALYEEAVDVVRKRMNIEIKSQGDEEEDARLADFIIADLRRRGRADDVMISSISPEVIRYIKRKYPAWPTGQIYWLTASTFLPFDGLTEGLYESFRDTQADYLMLHVSNLHNIKDLLKMKPEGKTIMFWDFDDRMYMVHKDLDDRLWGTSRTREAWQRMRHLFH